MPIWVAAIFIVFAGAVCQGLTGFGFGLVIIPLLSIAWEVKAVVVSTTVLGSISILPLLFQVRARVRFKPVLALLVGTAAGTPIGVAMLVIVDSDILKIWVSVVVISLSVLYAFSQRLRLRSQAASVGVAVGALSGLLRGSTGMGGPPIALYLLGREEDVEGFRSTFLAYLFPAGLMTLAGFATAGQITPTVLTVSATSLPALFLGLWLGATLRHRIRPKAFQSVILAVLVFTSSVAIVSVLV